MKDSTSEYAIEVSNLKKSYTTVPVLKGIHFKVKQGEFVTILGPNGAGKTTFIKIIASILRPSSGKILLYGKPLYPVSERIRKDIGFISHQSLLYAQMTARENLKFYSKLYHLDNIDDKIDKVLVDVSMLEHGNSLVKTFSRGMQQRLSIARALIHNPSILLLDEPYSGLDPYASSLLSNLLIKLKGNNHSIIMITHHIEQAIGLSDRVCIQYSGQIVYENYCNNIDKDEFSNTYLDIINSKGKSVFSQDQALKSKNQ